MDETRRLQDEIAEIESELHTLDRQLHTGGDLLPLADLESRVLALQDRIATLHGRVDGARPPRTAAQAPLRLN